MVLVLAGMFSFARLSVAQEPPSADDSVDIETSRRAVNLGKEAHRLYESGDYDGAYALFEQADRLLHSPAFVLYMARCRREVGRLVEAAKLYERVATETLPADAPEPWRAAKEDAVAELAGVNARIPSLRIVVRGRAPERVELDERVVEVAEPIRVDPGAHTVVVTTTDGQRKRRELTVAAGAGEVSVEVVVPVLPAPPPSSTPPPDAVEPIPILWPGGVVLGIGAASLVASAITGFSALGVAESVNATCSEDNICPASEQDNHDRAMTLAHVSTATAAVGAALAATGIALLIWAPTTTDSGDVQVGVSPSGVTFVVRF